MSADVRFGVFLGCRIISWENRKMQRTLEAGALRVLFTQRWITYMPMKPKRPCKHPGCPRLTGGQYCELHAKVHAGDRASAFERGYSHRWQMVRKQFLVNHPLCALCEQSGKLMPATVVDHVLPHRGDKALFWDERNWQPLCKKCHDRKTRMLEPHQNYVY